MTTTRNVFPLSKVDNLLGAQGIGRALNMVIVFVVAMILVVVVIGTITVPHSHRVATNIAQIPRLSTPSWGVSSRM